MTKLFPKFKYELNLIITLIIIIIIMNEKVLMFH